MLVMRIDGTDLDVWKNEAGGHRIQRIPPTEKKGRVHTSTVTVAVIEDAARPRESVDIDDCDISWFSGTGPGGQNRNKVMASCRLKHRETGVVVSAQTRSRSQSLDQALSELRRRVQELSDTSHGKISRAIRKEQVGSGQRGDKIRTIQFQNDTATDHRTGKRITADQYIKGHMDRLWP